jgi:hypothetical protein
VGDEAPVDSDRPLSLRRPFPCLGQGAGAASASDPLRVDVVVVHALAVLRVFDTDWDRPGAGRCELVPLEEVVLVGRLAVPRVPRTDWRSPGGDWAVARGSSPHDDAATGRTLAAPRISPGLTDWGRSDAAAERATQVGSWRVAGSLLVLLLLVVLPAALEPPTLRASSSPSTLFEPVTDLLLLRLTLGGASSHKDPSSAQPSASSAPSCGEKGGG